MFKKVKKVGALFCSSLLACIPVLSTATVAMAEGEGNVNVIVTYDGDITPQNNDDFIITYSPEDDQYNESNITLDASKGNTKINVEPKSYVILNVEYVGENDEIIEQGYSINKDFYCSDSMDGQFEIAIGDESVQKMASKFTSANIRIKDAEHDELGNSTREQMEEEMEQREEATGIADDDNVQDMETDANTDAIITETTTGNEPSTAPVGETTETEAPIVTNTGEAKVEKYIDEQEEQKEKEKKEEKKQSGKNMALIKLVGILIFAVIGFGIIFILHAKGRDRKSVV